MSSGGRISRISSCVRDLVAGLEVAGVGFLHGDAVSSAHILAPVSRESEFASTSRRSRSAFRSLALRRSSRRAGRSADRAAQRFEHLDGRPRPSGHAVAALPPPSPPSTTGWPGSPRRSSRRSARAAASLRASSICRGTARAARWVSSRSASRGGPLPCSPPVQKTGVMSAREEGRVCPQHEPGQVRAVRLGRGLQERPAGPRTPPDPAAASASSRRSAPSCRSERIHRFVEVPLQALQEHRALAAEERGEVRRRGLRRPRPCRRGS